MQLSALNEFSWGDFGTAISKAISSAPDYYTQYRKAQLEAEAAKAKAQSDAQIAIARATLQSGQGSMFNYGYGASTRGAAFPQIMSPVGGSTNYMPMILIGGFGIAAVLLLMRR